MITIRREQMAAFEAEQMLQFKNRLIEEISTALLAQAGDQRAREIANAALAKAKDFGAESEEAIRTLAGLMRLYGEAFIEEGPAWIAPGLADGTASGDDKVAWLGLMYRSLPAEPLVDDSSPEFES